MLGVIIIRLIKIAIKFLKKQLFVSIFIGLILFVGLIVLIKFPFRKTTDLYVTVKISQGFWWANTPKPGIWFLQAFKKREKEYNLLGKPIAEIMSVRYYQQADLDLNQFDIYLLVKLSVEDARNKGYMFKRTKIAIGSPIDLDFTNSQITGTIVNLNVKKITPNYIEKNITLTKKTNFPWEFDVIKVGDKYFDGEENILEITDKEAVDTYIGASLDSYGSTLPQVLELRKYITIKAKIKLRKNSYNQLIFGEEQVIKVDSYANLTTNNTILSDYKVASLD